MKYLLKEKRGYITERPEYVDVNENISVEFEFENGIPNTTGSGLYAVFLRSDGKEFTYKIDDEFKVSLNNKEINKGLFSLTVVLVTGNEINKSWRCEPFSIESLTDIIGSAYEVNENMEVLNEIKTLNEEIKLLKDRVELLENEYDPRNI